MSEKKVVLKPWVRISLLLFIMVVFISGIGVIYKGFHLQKKENTKAPIYTYHISENLDYKVYLNKNSFIDVPYLGKNETYISDLIKNMEITFQYHFSGVKEIPLEYSYEVVTDMKGEYQAQTGEEKSKVWAKNEVIVPKETKQISGSQFMIQKTIQLDYHKYNKEVQQFRKELNLPITAYLDVSILISFKGSAIEEFEKQQVISLKIPLNEQAFKITEEYQPKDEGLIYGKSTYTGEVNQKNLICGIILMIVSIFVLFLFCREIFNIQKKNYYTIQLNKIMKSYGDVIIELATPIDLREKNIVEVKNFNEMIDLEEELRVPINFYEQSEYYKGDFYIVQGDIVYCYHLKNEEKN